MLTWVLCAVVSQAAAVADDTPFAPPPMLNVEGEEPKAEPPNFHFGVALDVGLPDGAGLTVYAMPARWIRIGAAVLTHGGGVGVRATLTVVPFAWVVRPTLTAEAGHYFKGNLGWFLSATTPQPLREVLGQAEYDFFNAHAGFEIGSKRVAFVLRGGFSYVGGVLAPTTFTQDGGTVSAGATHFQGFSPSAKAGLIVCF
jgi:hypothetical protein